MDKFGWLVLSYKGITQLFLDLKHENTWIVVAALTQAPTEVKIIVILVPVKVIHNPKNTETRPGQFLHRDKRVMLYGGPKFWTKEFNVM